MKDLEDWAAVHRVYKQTGSKRATADILGIARNTVRRLLEKTEPPVYNRTEYSSKIVPFKEQIITWRCDPFNFNGTRIFSELQKRGYKGSIGPVLLFSYTLPTIWACSRLSPVRARPWRANKENETTKVVS